MSEQFVHGMDKHKSPQKNVKTIFNDFAKSYPDAVGYFQSLARLWQFAFFGLLLITLLLTMGIIYVASLSKTDLKFVAVQPTGEIMVGDTKDDYSNYNIPKAAVSVIVKNFIHDAFSIPLDSNVCQDWINRSKSFTTKNSEGILISMWQTRKVNDLLKQRIRIVTKTETTFWIKDNIWQSEWIETAYNSSGDIQEIHRYRGIFTVVFIAPTTQSFDANPTGTYFDNFDVQEISVK